MERRRALPTEMELAEQYSVSRVTVRRAIGAPPRTGRGRHRPQQGHVRGHTETLAIERQRPATQLPAWKMGVNQMHLGLGGYSPGNEDDPFVILGAVLDQPFLVGPISKDRREDLQVWSALQALAGAGVSRHPLGVRLGEDPQTGISSMAAGLGARN